jgi:hypothetical protein
MIALENLPLHETRKAELNKFESQLETMVAGHILDAFESKNLAQVQKLCAVLSKVDRIGTSRRFYLQSRADTAQAFFSKHFGSSLALNSSVSPREWAPGMFEELMKLITQEMDWCKNLQCLATPYSVLIDDLLETVLSELRQQLSMYLADVIKRRDALFVTSEFFNVMLQFCAELSDVFNQQQVGQIASPKSPSKESSSIILNTFQPFSLVFQAYVEIEKRQLDAFLDNFRTSIRVDSDIGSNDPNEIFRFTTGQLRASNAAVVELIRSSQDRMFSFSGGIVAPAFDSLVDDFLCSYVKRYIEILKQLRRVSGYNNVEEIKADYSMAVFANAEMLFDLLRCSREFVDGVKSVRTGILAELSTVITDVLSVKKGLGGDFSSNFVFSFLLMRMAGQIDALVPYVQGTGDLFASFLKTIPDFSRYLEVQVQDSLLCRIMIRLKDFSTLDVWKTPDKKSIIPMFSSNPSDFITYVGDELLSLAQQSEIQAVFPVDFEHKAGHVEMDEDLSAVMYWLEKVVNRVVAVLEEKICRIPLLTKEGAKQLVIDFDCLMRIIDALGLEIPERLLTLKTFVSISGEDLKELVAANPKQRDLARSVAKIRRMNIQI